MRGRRTPPEKVYDEEAALQYILDSWMRGSRPTRIRKEMYDRLGVPFDKWNYLATKAKKELKEQMDVYNKEGAKLIQLARLEWLLGQINPTTVADTKNYLKTLELINKITGLEKQELVVEDKRTEFVLGEEK